MSKLIDYAEAELAGLMRSKDPNTRRIAQDALDLLKVFVRQKHTIVSAPYVAAIFGRLSMWLPIAPLSGEPWEWNPPNEQGVQQNRRCAFVYRNADGIAYNGRASIYQKADGSCVTSPPERIEFPYMVLSEPKIVSVDEEGKPLS